MFIRGRLFYAPILSNENVNAFEKEKGENVSLLDEAEEIPEEILRNFYSKIKSLEILKLIIENVFRISLKNTEEQSIALINSFVQDAVYERIWNTYTHTDKEMYIQYPKMVFHYIVLYILLIVYMFYWHICVDILIFK